jgi:hypothetical protein
MRRNDKHQNTRRHIDLTMVMLHNLKLNQEHQPLTWNDMRKAPFLVAR